MKDLDRLAVWNRIQTFSFDKPESSFTFSDRLKKDFNWGDEITTRATQEYKRFLFLCVVTEHKCVPSDFVDKVWHTHLIYTKSYWCDLCPNTLQMELHHEPGTAPLQKKSFLRSYISTLKSYESFIGHTPPADMWGELKDYEELLNG